MYGTISSTHTGQRPGLIGALLYWLYTGCIQVLALLVDSLVVEGCEYGSGPNHFSSAPSNITIGIHI